MIELRAGAATDVGEVRAVNEDSILISERYFAVADGMGGHAAGEVASALAIARVARIGDRHDLNPEDVRAELARANDDILDSVLRHPERDGMGTTLAGIGLGQFAGSEHWIVFNIGDSRVYHCWQDTALQVTVDHTERAEHLAAGIVGPDGTEKTGRRNMVTRALGSNPPPQADLWVLPPTPGERFLICSDGLYVELTDARIGQILGEQPAPQDAADALVRAAVRAGGRDNVSAVVVDHVHHKAP